MPCELVEQMLDYTYDYNFKVCITAMNIILNLVSHHPQVTRPKIKKIEVDQQLRVTIQIQQKCWNNG